MDDINKKIAEEAGGVLPERTETAYEIDLEGVIHSWPTSSILVEELAALAGWVLEHGIVEVDADSIERQLKSGDKIELKPGHGFAKKRKWKRGC